MDGVYECDEDKHDRQATDNVFAALTQLCLAIPTRELLVSFPLGDFFLYVNAPSGARLT